MEELKFIFLKTINNFDKSELERFSNLSYEDKLKEIENLEKQHTSYLKVKSFYENEIKEFHIKKEEIKNKINKIYEEETEIMLKKDKEIKDLIQEKIKNLNQEELREFKRINNFIQFDLLNKMSKSRIRRKLGDDEYYDDD